MIDFILDAIFWFAIIYFVMKVIEIYLVAKNKALEQELEELTRKVKDKVIHVDIEKHGNVFYLFEKDTNRFIAQGASFEEVKHHCQTRFKDKSVVADESQMNQFGFK